MRRSASARATADVARADDAAHAEIDARSRGCARARRCRRSTSTRTRSPRRDESTYERAKFLADVERIKEYIVAGDCFQVLLARRIVLPHDFDGTALYRALRALNPSPYMYHLVLDGVEIVGSSPELLVRVAGGRVTVRPIAGTRPRGATAPRTTRSPRELLADEKERAEHVMLVDLGPQRRRARRASSAPSA